MEDFTLGIWFQFESKLFYWIQMYKKNKTSFPKRIVFCLGHIWVSFDCATRDGSLVSNVPSFVTCPSAFNRNKA